MRLALGVALAGLPAVAAGDVVRYDWTPVKGAAYYEGTIGAGKDAIRIRTPDHWLLLGPDETVAVHAFDTQARRLGPVKEMTQTPLADGAGPPVVAAPAAVESDAQIPSPATPAPAAVESPAPAAVENAAPAVPDDVYADAERGDAAYGDTETSTSDEEEASTPAFPELAPDAAPTAAPQDAAPTETPPPTGAVTSTADTDAAAPDQATLALGVGKEWLEAKGGVSEYKGSANIGGTTVHGDVHLGKSLYAGLELGAHNFTTTVTETNATTGETAESESKFLRLGARAVAFYDVLADGTPAPTTLGVGLGLGYFRLPVLTIVDATTGAAKLDQRAAFGPVAAVEYARRLTGAHTLGVAAHVLPTALGGKAKALSTNVLAFWRHRFVKRLFTELSLISTRESLALPVTCPDVADCKATSDAASSLFAARAGLGTTF